MKKLLTVLFALTLTFPWIRTVSAQRDPYRTPNPDPYQEYVFNLNQYFADRQKFDSSRSKYLAYKTEQSKEDALRDSKMMLESGRIALYLYVIRVSSALEAQPELNQRVKNTIMSDLTKHIQYLIDAQASISSIATLPQATDVGNAMNLRLNYVKLTTDQAISYIEAAKVKNYIDDSYKIVQSYSQLMNGFPQTSDEKIIIDKWVSDTVARLAENERKMYDYLENLYPAAYTTVAYFENPSRIPFADLNTLFLDQKALANKYKEIFAIAQKAYRELE